MFTVAFFDRETRALNVFYLVDMGTPVGDALRQHGGPHGAHGHSEAQSSLGTPSETQ